MRLNASALALQGFTKKKKKCSYQVKAKVLQVKNYIKATNELFNKVIVIRLSMILGAINRR